MLYVCKFGGSSVSTLQGLINLKEIVLTKSDRKVVVVSAIGSRFSGDIKVTDLLFRLSENLNDSVLKEEIESRFNYIAKILGVDVDIKEQLNFKSADEAIIVSRGEYLTAKIVAKYIGYAFKDASEILFFKNGKLLVNKSRRALEKIDLNGGVVVPGFYVNENGRLSLLERGGSDLSGAYLSKLLKADVYENYTDVCGLKCVDPSVVSNALTVEKLSYKDFKRLGVIEPKILQKSAYKPVIGTKTTTKIINTYNFCGGFTQISNAYFTRRPKIFGIGCQKNSDGIAIVGRKLKDAKIKSAVKDAFFGFNYSVTKNDGYLMIIHTNLSGPLAVKLLYSKLKSFV